MARKYDSSRRDAVAAQTRQSIVEAAVKLHGMGITTLSAVAEEAGVSLPTVNKYFPTREDLFGACTRHVAENLEYASPDELAAIPDRREQLEAVVRQILSLHEQVFGQAWTGYVLEDESPVMAGAMAEYEEQIYALVDVILGSDPGSPVTGDFIQGLLHPLTYRALRLKQGLAFEATVEQMTLTLKKLLDIA